MPRRTTPSAGELEHVLRAQDGVITRPQALDCGLTPGAIRHRIRAGGPWQRLLPSVYLTVTGKPTTAQKEIATRLYAGPRSAITGVAALRHYGLRAPSASAMSVLVPTTRTRHVRDFVAVWPTTRMPREVNCDGLVRFAVPARALVDACREVAGSREMRALVAAAVQQGRCRIDALRGELERAPVRHSAWLRRALAEVADGIRSVAEGDLRDLLLKSHLPMPMFNAHLYAGQTLIAIADAWWPEAGVAVEVDSREWHLSPADWERTLRRHATMGARGIIVLHFTPRQLRDEPAEVVAHIAAALSAGQARRRPDVRAVPAAG